MDGLLQVLHWSGCSAMLSFTYILLGAALHVCLPGFKLNSSSSYYSRKAVKTKYIKAIAKINSTFPLLLTKLLLLLSKRTWWQTLTGRTPLEGWVGRLEPEKQKDVLCSRSRKLMAEPAGLLTWQDKKLRCLEWIQLTQVAIFFLTLLSLK